MIICAAISLTYKNKNDQLLGAIICGHRHSNCYTIMQHMDIATKVNVTEGFINHKGEFLDREEAFKHALECGQINCHNEWYRADNKVPNELYSEDLY